MPRGDGTGPMGMGPMTGRGMGCCVVNTSSGFGNSIPGRGRGIRNGRGYGFGNARGLRCGWAVQSYPSAIQPLPYSSQDEINDLKNQAKLISETLESINNRINEIQSDK